ncbi:NAD-binding protein [Ectothiorhodospiraceae bacterium WFHF3C12]|nr:NAD-binding protein [Ectothiorhodospiraceae bacterium WFHF3C12]
MEELLQLPRHSVIPMVLRRMRPPLITLIVAYSISVLGFVLIPGETASGEPHRMDFLHAFYFASYTATTIGFGEIPNAFTEAQRLWATFSLYVLVIAWFTAIGSIIGLIRDPVFQRVVTWNRFRRQVRKLAEPFHLVCGYGDTGAQLVQEVTALGARAVVIDQVEGHTYELGMEDLRSYVPAFCGDASLADNLLAAGLTHPRCASVLAVTDDDHANLQIAITAKLLNPRLPVIARAGSGEVQANMASFGTDHIVNAFDTFAGGFVMAIQSPYVHRLYEWMSPRPEIPLTSDRLPPPGRWIICAPGRLGKMLHRRLREMGTDMVLVAEELPPWMSADQPQVEGKGTEAETLRRAGIDLEETVGVIAGTDDDVDNLSIIITARQLRPELFMVARQSDRSNRYIFEAADLDMIMEPSGIIALRMMRQLTTPMLPQFLRGIRDYDDDYVGELLANWQARMGRDTPRVRALTLGWRDAPAVADALLTGHSVTVGDLLLDPANRRESLAAEVLMIEREGEQMFLPPPDTPLAPGDTLLLCSSAGALRPIAWTVNNMDAFRYVMTGEQRPDGWLWRWLARRRETAGSG